jgi:pimeloyl-ACP methyl ester carboxylesterase
VPEEVRFASGDGECAGTLYRPAAASLGRTPCVVMANGVSMTRRDGIPRFAKRFADSGIAALAFDFRHLGDSDGRPRQLVDVDLHRADFGAAVELARSIQGVDDRRVAVWGFSLGGGVALATAIEDPGVAAAVLLCPIVDVLARNNVRLFGAALRALARRQKSRLPLTGPPGTTVLFTQPEAAPGFEAVKGEGSLWSDEIRFDPARPATRLRPARSARRVRCPLMVCLGLEDTIVPARPIERTASEAPRGELRRYPIGHFTPFLDGFDAVASDQAEFLTRHLAPRGSSPATAAEVDWRA